MDLMTEDMERHRQLLHALTTEQLQTARASTLAARNGRAAPLYEHVSGAVVALAFIGQVAHVGAAFFIFAIALLPTLLLLGVLTYLRRTRTGPSRRLTRPGTLRSEPSVRTARTTASPHGRS